LEGGENLDGQPDVGDVHGSLSAACVDLATAAREIAEVLKRLRSDLDDLTEAISDAEPGRTYVFPRETS
jgi:hypothetical protein